MMAVMCSIIEFLESTHQGMNFRYRKENDPQLTEHEYSSSEEIMTNFLSTRPPFSAEFKGSLATDFYKQVRCPLLHEGRTSGRWTLKANSKSDQILKVSSDDIKLNRTAFWKAIKEYASKHYKHELDAKDEVKKALLRKMDFICCE